MMPTPYASRRAREKRPWTRVDVRRRPSTLRRFVGVDGEGVTLPRAEIISVGEFGKIDTRHQYRFLRAGESTIEVQGRALRWYECLDFLSGLSRAPLYQSFFFDYDVTCILRGAPESTLKRLLAKEKIDQKKQVVGVTFWHGNQGWDVAYIPRKEFRVKRVDQKKYLCISDAGSFFQTAFMNAITVWDVMTPDERDIIAIGKENRGEVAEITEEEKRYNWLECVALSKLMNKFRDVCKEVGVTPRKWQGPGHLASVLLRQHHTIVGADVHLTEQMVKRSYQALHFGRFEELWAGNVGDVYEYDINSAYPWAMTQLPCLVHGEWSQEIVPTTELWLSAGNFVHDNVGTGYRCLPVRRKDGTIYYPNIGEGSYWSPEIMQGVMTGGLVWNGVTYFCYHENCDCKPFSWVNELYQQRLKLGKTLKGKTLKLAMNSMYGKMAQTVGAAQYFNPVYCGLITSMTRTKLLQAANAQDDVIMFATDAIYTREKRYLDEGSKLGQWSSEKHSDIHVVQPGLYFTGDGGKVKTRGIPKSQFEANKHLFMEAFNNIYLDPENVASFNIPIPINAFIGLRLANQRNRLDLAGEWVHTIKHIGYDWSSKRQYERTGGTREKGFIITRPLQGNNVPSVAYTKALRMLITGRALEEDWSRIMDQPDWAEQIVDRD